jgi:hypothetical protein
LLSAKTIHVSIYIDDLNSDGGSTVTPDVMDTGLEDTRLKEDEHESDTSSLEDLSKMPRLLKSALIKEVSRFNSNCIGNANM